MGHRVDECVQPVGHGKQGRSIAAQALAVYQTREDQLEADQYDQVVASAHQAWSQKVVMRESAYALTNAATRRSGA